MVTVTLRAKGKVRGLPEVVDLGKGTTGVSDLIEAIANDTKLNSDRIRLTVKNEDSKMVKDRVLRVGENLEEVFPRTDRIEVFVRDLGPQIAWRTVFLIEYLGPLLIHPLFFYGQQLCFGKAFEHTSAQKLVFAMAVGHFLKREYETAFIHKFSLATMPLFNLFKNSSHYWVLSGFNFYWVYAPADWSAKSSLNKFLFGHDFLPLSDLAQSGLAAFWLYAEVSNFITHLNLASLRPTGSTERRIPYGYGFNLVSCPNYFFESLSWLVVFCLSQNWASLLFFVVGTAQMWAWALKKHRRYKREFPDYPKNRKVYVPFLL
jgi:very-long-chain enoyl-CoA reductase